MYDIILFDLDGTLTDPKEGITKSVQYALEKMGYFEPDLDKLTSFIGPPLTDIFMSQYGMTLEEASQSVLKYRERFSTVGLFENFVYPGIPKLLEELSQSGVSLALATSKPEIFSLKIMEKFDLGKYFTCMVGSGLNGELIDKAAVIEEVFKRLKSDNFNSAIMIGDTKYDIIGAQKNNIKSIGVKYGYGSQRDLEEAGADYIVDTVDDLSDLLFNKL